MFTLKREKNRGESSKKDKEHYKGNKNCWKPKMKYDCKKNYRKTTQQRTEIYKGNKRTDRDRKVQRMSKEIGLNILLLKGLMWLDK